MSSQQEKNRHVVTQLVLWARKRGVTQQALRTVVHNMVTAGVSTDHWRYEETWRAADMINKAGLRSQISYMVEVLGPGRVADTLDELNVLDNFAREATSAAEPIEETEEDLDADGDPWE
jgi:hypothetical protein